MTGTADGGSLTYAASGDLWRVAESGGPPELDGAVLQPSSAVLNNPAPNATIIESAAIPASFGQATSTRDARQMQFGLKIIW
jgi:DNA-binding winged helix-turn-helix (wHTH) protein